MHPPLLPQPLWTWTWTGCWARCPGRYMGSGSISLPWPDSTLCPTRALSPVCLVLHPSAHTPVAVCVAGVLPPEESPLAAASDSAPRVRGIGRRTHGELTRDTCSVSHPGTTPTALCEMAWQVACALLLLTAPQFCTGTPPLPTGQCPGGMSPPPPPQPPARHRAGLANRTCLLRGSVPRPPDRRGAGPVHLVGSPLPASTILPAGLSLPFPGTCHQFFSCFSLDHTSGFSSAVSAGGSPSFLHLRNPGQFHGGLQER